MNQARMLTVLSWAAVVLTCAYFFLAYNRLVWETEHFARMCEGYGVPLPLPGRMVLSWQGVLFPLLFAVPGLLIVAKELFLRDARTRLIVTLALAIAVLIATDLVRAALTLPLQRFAEGLA